MRPALLLVDMQADFLGRPGLTPPAGELTGRVAHLLERCRAANVPVLHVHTLVSSDGNDRMPHWKRNGTWACVAGSPGARVPPGLEPAPGEHVYPKQYFSAFSNPDLAGALRRLGVDTLIVSGVYLHGCIRTSVLDAYQQGLQVWVADDAVGATDLLHGEITRQYLDGRAAAFMHSDSVLQRLVGGSAKGDAPTNPGPVAWIENRWRPHGGEACLRHRDPSDQHQILGDVPVAGVETVHEATASAANALNGWRSRPASERAAVLKAWRQGLEQKVDELVRQLTVEIGKPVSAAREEMERALAHIKSAERICLESPDQLAGVHVRYRPLGVVGLITPWNNPVAIPVGKLSAALAFGNTVVWKPAYQACRSAALIAETLRDADAPPGVFNLVFGDADTGRLVAIDPRVSAVSVTGSVATGRTLAALCALDGKPLQAELGGNNAAIVLRDCDLSREAPLLAMAAFGFAGQRCTATRRFIVEEAIREEFQEHMVEATRALRLGYPADPATQIGPLISAGHLEHIERVLARARQDGARLLCGGRRPEKTIGGCWIEPALLCDVDPGSAVVQDESFGPIAVVLAAPDLNRAIELANGVRYGLVASIHTGDANARARAAEELEAGILNLSVQQPLAINPDAPFGGWKASGIGPPEHGIWDRQFYTRAQSVYADKIPILRGSG